MNVMNENKNVNLDELVDYLIPVNWDGEPMNYENSLINDLNIIGDFSSYRGEFMFDDKKYLNDGVEKLRLEDIEILSVNSDEKTIRVNKESLPDVISLPNHMVVDVKDNYMMRFPEDLPQDGEISYIGYTGGYPCLCAGTLWIKLDTTFVGLTNVLSNFGGWVVCEESLPQALKARAKEIQALANERIPTECCGGCL